MDTLLTDVPIYDRTNECLIHNIHVRQNPNSCYKSFYFNLDENIPELEYRRTQNNGLRSTIHNGQRKLLMTELYFLSKYYNEFKDDENVVMIYAGSAPGTHIQYLSELFPQIQFILVDPNNFTVKETPKIKIYQEYFTNELAHTFKIEFSNYTILFCSDIRRSDPDFMDNQRVEEVVKEDMQMQVNWAKILCSKLNIVKFRLPYSHYIRQGDNDKDIYPEGEILIQPWAPLTSSETRLIFKYDAPLIEYNSLKYENQMFWHNRIGRVMCYNRGIVHDEENGLDHCWDCSAEYNIIDLYLKNVNTNINILEISRYITYNVLKSQIKYPMRKFGYTKKKQNIKSHQKITNHFN